MVKASPRSCVLCFSAQQLAIFLLVLPMPYVRFLRSNCAQHSCFLLPVCKVAYTSIPTVANPVSFANGLKTWQIICDQITLRYFQPRFRFPDPLLGTWLHPTMLWESYGNIYQKLNIIPWSTDAPCGSRDTDKVEIWMWEWSTINGRINGGWSWSITK